MDRHQQPPVVDHMVLPVSSREISTAFYRAALGPLGIEQVDAYVGDDAVAFGRPGAHDFAIRESATPARGVHLAFGAHSRAQVDTFYTAALAAGATGNGAPGPRPEYSADYYGAFVLDPDGNNVEAVCHDR